MDTLKVTQLALPGVLLLEPKMFADERGFFAETYNEKTFAQHGIEMPFVQDNLSSSKKGVIRGMHMQKSPHAQAKLVRCPSGEVFDVIADCDPHSPTYGRHVSVMLSGESERMVYIPGQYAHGFCVVSEDAIFEYKASDFYHPECAVGIRYDDPLLAIPWPVQEPILSEQDKKWSTL